MSASWRHWGPQGADVDSAGALPRGPDTRGALGTQGPPAAWQTLTLRASPTVFRDSG